MKTLKEHLLEALKEHPVADLSDPADRERVADSLYESVREFGKAYTIELLHKVQKGKGNGSDSDNKGKPGD